MNGQEQPGDPETQLPTRGCAVPSAWHGAGGTQTLRGGDPGHPPTHIRAGWSHAAGGSGESCGSLGKERRNVAET